MDRLPLICLVLTSDSIDLNFNADIADSLSVEDWSKKKLKFIQILQYAQKDKNQSISIDFQRKIVQAYEFWKKMEEFEKMQPLMKDSHFIFPEEFLIENNEIILLEEIKSLWEVIGMAYIIYLLKQHNWIECLKNFQNLLSQNAYSYFYLKHKNQQLLTQMEILLRAFTDFMKKEKGDFKQKLNKFFLECKSFSLAIGNLIRNFAINFILKNRDFKGDNGESLSNDLNEDELREKIFNVNNESYWKSHILMICSILLRINIYLHNDYQLFKSEHQNIKIEFKDQLNFHSKIILIHSEKYKLDYHLGYGTTNQDQTPFQIYLYSPYDSEYASSHCSKCILSTKKQRNTKRYQLYKLECSHYFHCFCFFNQQNEEGFKCPVCNKNARSEYLKAVMGKQNKKIFKKSTSEFIMHDSQKMLKTYHHLPCCELRIDPIIFQKSFPLKWNAYLQKCGEFALELRLNCPNCEKEIDEEYLTSIYPKKKIRDFKNQRCSICGKHYDDMLQSICEHFICRNCKKKNQLFKCCGYCLKSLK